jgi:fatty-acyl-CoA synthase
MILESAAAHPDADAIVLPGDRVSYRDFAAGAAEWSRVFIALGVLKGDHVGILLPNGTQFMQVLVGAMLAGAVPVPINARYRGPEIAALLADADLVTVITTNDVEQRPSLIERLHEALPELSSAGAPERLSLVQAPRLKNIVTTQGPPSPGCLHRRAVAASAAGIASEEIDKRRRSVRPEDTALILYTSGSTALPKGCMLSHAAIVTQGRLLAARYQMTARDRIWSPLPMFHVGGISPLMAILCRRHRHVAETVRVDAAPNCLAAVTGKALRHGSRDDQNPGFRIRLPGGGSGDIHPRRHGLFGRNRYAALLARRPAAAHRTGQQ